MIMESGVIPAKLSALVLAAALAATSIAAQLKFSVGAAFAGAVLVRQIAALTLPETLCQAQIRFANS